MVYVRPVMSVCLSYVLQMVNDQHLFEASSLAREELQNLYKQLREAQKGTSELRQYHDNKVEDLKAEQVSISLQSK